MNLKILYEILVIQHNEPCVPTYRLSQDFLERYFQAIRLRNGSNPNPTIYQMKFARLRLITHCQIKDNGFGNCIALEHLDVLHISSNPTTRINMTLNVQRSDGNEIDDCETDDVDLYVPYAHILTMPPLSIYCEKVLEYIGGFVVHNLQKSLKCADCNEMLVGEHNFKSLIAYKNFGSLKYPSDSVMAIVKCVETLLRNRENPNLTPDMKEFTKIKYSAKRVFVTDSKIFPDDNVSHCLQFHKTLLIEAVVEKFLRLRFHFIHKESRNFAGNNRQQISHVLNFKGF